MKLHCSNFFERWLGVGVEYKALSFKLQFKSMTLFPNLVNSFWTRMNRLRMFCCQLIKKSLILLGNMHPSAYNWIKDSLFNYSIKILAQENLTSFFQKYLSHTLIKLFLHQASDRIFREFFYTKDEEYKWLKIL